LREAQQCGFLSFMAEVERISVEPSEAELQAIIKGLHADLTEPAPG
jgi:hypothetical protein